MRVPGMPEPIEWTLTTPTTEGTYVFKRHSEWPLSTRQVKKGQWRLTQDPDQLYAGIGELVSSLDGYWYGPLPEVPDRWAAM
jgi:hypothetical protein